MSRGMLPNKDSKRRQTKGTLAFKKLDSWEGEDEWRQMLVDRRVPEPPAELGEHGQVMWDVYWRGSLRWGMLPVFMFGFAVTCQLWDAMQRAYAAGDDVSYGRLVTKFHQSSKVFRMDWESATRGHVDIEGSLRPAGPSVATVVADELEPRRLSAKERYEQRQRDAES